MLNSFAIVSFYDSTRMVRLHRLSLYSVLLIKDNEVVIFYKKNVIKRRGHGYIMACRNVIESLMNVSNLYGTQQIERCGYDSGGKN